jgi:dihydroorotase-like cyclic amidohydrolase
MDHEVKNCEWGSAGFGAATIEDAFSWFHAHYGSADDLEVWVEAVAHKPRELFGLGSVSINVGSPADFTLFTLEGSVDRQASLGVNRPKWSKNGFALGVVLDAQAYPATA